MTKTQKEVKQAKEKDINLMSTMAILWHVIRRHDRFLLILMLFISWTLFLVNSLPSSIHSVIK